jgi:hypothetical protein
MVLYKLYVFYSDMKFKMAATAGLSSYVKTMSCSGSHLGITINIKNTKFVKNLPMIDAQFRFNQCNSFREEYISVFIQDLPLKNSKFSWGGGHVPNPPSISSRVPLHLDMGYQFFFSLGAQMATAYKS